MSARAQVVVATPRLVERWQCRQRAGGGSMPGARL